MAEEISRDRGTIKRWVDLVKKTGDCEDIAFPKLEEQAEQIADDEWVAWSDNQIAEKCSVSQPFVSSIRRSLKTNVSEKPASRSYTTKHGTTATMKTGNIGKKATAKHGTTYGARRARKRNTTPCVDMHTLLGVHSSYIFIFWGGK